MFIVALGYRLVNTIYLCNVIILYPILGTRLPYFGGTDAVFWGHGCRIWGGTDAVFERGTDAVRSVRLGTRVTRLVRLGRYGDVKFVGTKRAKVLTSMI